MLSLERGTMLGINRLLYSLRVFTVILFVFASVHPASSATSAATTTTTLAITASGAGVASVNGGSLVTLTATVQAGGKAVTAGQVNFCDASATLCSDIHLLGTVPLTSSGTAALQFVPRPGSHSYKAEFVSTVNDNASVSAAEPLLVYGVTTSTITQSGSAGNYTLKATVTGSSLESAPTGKVDFRDTSNGNSVLATASLGTGTSAATWVNTQNPATPVQPLSILVGDFNGDGIPDIAIGTNGIASGNGGAITGYLSILLGNGDGTFQAARTVTALPNNQALAAGNFVAGGPLDILTVDNTTTGTNNAALFIGDGKGGGTLGAPFSLGGIANVTAIATGDFNRDGNEDFVITGVAFGVYCFAPLLGNGNGTFGAPTLNAIGNNPLLVAVGAFNTNGYPDIVVVDTVVGQATVFQNNSQGFFFPVGQANTGANPTAMVTGDFNGDGYLDLAVVNGGSNDVTILLGHGDETLTAGSTTPTGNAPTSIAVGDFNGDGIADLAVVNSGDGTVSILLGDGTGAFAASKTLSTGINPVNVAVGDFSGAGLTTLAVTNQDIANTNGSTLTVEAAELTQTANATASKIAPTGIGTHLVDAAYEGDSLYAASTSATTSLTGSNPPYTITVAPTSLTFASTQVGDTSAAQTVNLTNTGSSAVSITSVTASADFAVANNCGASIATGAGCTLSVTFVPTTSGNLTGTVTITDNASGSPQAVALTGVATNPPPTISVSPASLSFASTVVGVTSAAQSVKLTNTGKSAVSITSVNASANFAVTSSCGNSIAVGANCALSVTFVPTKSGTLTGTITITDNATGSPQSVSLSGTATVPVPTATVSPASLTFSAEPVGTASTAGTVTITNTGTVAVDITSIAASGDFSQTNTCGTSVAVASNCVVSVVFTPTTAGSRSGTLTITDNATGSPQTVSLTGTGSSVSLSPSSSSLSLGSSGSVTDTVQISSSEGFTGTVNLTCAVSYQGTGTPSNPPGCSLNPASGQVTATTSLTSTLTVTTGSATKAQQLASRSNSAWPRTGTVFAVLVLAGFLPRKRRKHLGLVVLLALGLGMTVSATGCGGSSGPKTTAGSYQVVVTAKSATVTASTTIALTVQ